MMNSNLLYAALVELILNSSKTIDEVRDQYNGEFPHVDQRIKDAVWDQVMEEMPELN